MIINISDIISREGTKMDFCGEIPGEHVFYENELKLVSPISIEGYAINLGNNCRIKANISAQCQFMCARCLESYTTLVSFEFEENLGSEENADYLIVEHNHVCVDNAVYMHLMSNLIGKHVCKESCKGLCPECGVNLNYTKCDCTKSMGDPRFEVLRGLLK